MTQQITGPAAAKPRRAVLPPLLLIAAALAAAAMYQYWRQSVASREAVLNTVSAEPDAGDVTIPAPQETQPQTEAAPTPEQAGEPVVAPPDLAAQLQQLNQALTTVSGGMAGLGHDIAALNARVASLEAAGVPGGGAIQAQISWSLALRDLERALAGPGPFEIELQALGKLAGIAADDPGIAGLLKFATAGIPPRALLAARFSPVAAAVVRAGAGADQGGWAGLLRGWSSALLTIRPLGEPEGDDAPAIVARAETRLAQGDLEAAVREIAALQGAAAAVAAEWLAAARARLQAERELAGLNARFAQALGGKQE